MHIGPHVKCGHQTGIHLVRNWILSKNSLLGLAIGPDVVGEVAAGPKDDFNRIP